MDEMTSLELCAGGGGQALGLEHAGFVHVALVENDQRACETLRHNRPEWRVIEQDLREFDAHEFEGVTLLTAGVPCPPFSVAGRQLGADDERDLFPVALRIATECNPRAIMFENVRGLLDSRFSEYRAWIDTQLDEMGYSNGWRLLKASDYGVPQLRPRVVMVALRKQDWPHFEWPEPQAEVPTVGETLFELMSSNGWEGADAWRMRANGIAPTVVGGSKLHGGPDLGPTRARAAWAMLGVDGRGVANEVPGPDHTGDPRLTVQMVARIQGFPGEWEFRGPKTHAYRQVGNAFPPKVAAAVASSIAAALRLSDAHRSGAVELATAE